MTIKNISGAELTLGFGRRTFVLANNATADLDEDARTLKYVAEHINAGRIQVVTGVHSKDVGHASSLPAHILVHCKAAGNDGDTVTFTPAGEVAQIFEMDPTPTASIEGATAVDIGANAAVTADNLKAAINANSILTKVGLKATDVIDHGTAEAWVVVIATGRVPITDVTIAESAAARIELSAVTSNPHSVLQEKLIHVTDCGGTTLHIVTGLNSIVRHEVVAHLDAAGDLTTEVDEANFSYFGGSLFIDDSETNDIADDDQLILRVYGN